VEVQKTHSEENVYKVDLEIATFVLRSGGTLLYPTETVWGLGCDATNEDAVQGLLELKRTYEQKALLVLVDSFDMAREYVKKMPHKATQILDQTDGPTTIVYPGAFNLAKNILDLDGSIGIRITTNPFCLDLIKAFKKPIVSTSANFAGKPTPQAFGDIDIDLIYNADYVVRYGQDAQSASKPSRVVKILENGEAKTIR
jgi:L-threonylcarbamoyladenylate synthase